MAKNVLIVDDSNTMRKIVNRSLRQAGLDVGEVIEAADGIEGLKALEDNDIDIVLSDINMPNMDGIEFLKNKQQNPDFADIPTCMITTEAASDILDQAKELGAIGNIKKPFKPDDIAGVLSSYF